MSSGETGSSRTLAALSGNGDQAEKYGKMIWQLYIIKAQIKQMHKEVDEGH